MRVLVTGHKGYIGSKVYKRCQELGYEVRGVDLKNQHDKRNILDFKYHEDLERYKPEIIFHLAANPRVQQSVELPSDVSKTNVLGTACVLEFARKVGCKRVVFSSSSAIYGNGDGPVSPYGLHKLQSELECKLYSQMFGVDTVCLRYFNVYSEDQKPSDVYPTVISAWMQRLREGRELTVYGEGQHRRDYIHVDDIVDCNLFAANYYGNFHGSYYDVGTGKNYDLNFIKNYILQNVGDVKFNHLPTRPTDALSTLSDTKNLNNMGWSAKIDFLDGLQKCFAKENIK
jgi:UDP-glucose 4-epimerase